MDVGAIAARLSAKVFADASGTALMRLTMSLLLQKRPAEEACGRCLRERSSGELMTLLKYADDGTLNLCQLKRHADILWQLRD